MSLKGEKRKGMPEKFEDVLKLPDWKINGEIFNLLKLDKNIGGKREKFLYKIFIKDGKLEGKEINENRFLPETAPTQSMVYIGDIPLKQIFTSLLAKQTSFLYFTNDIEYELLSLLTTSTYFREIFDKYPYADFFAMGIGCGKTTAMLTLIWASFYGFSMVTPTNAILFRAVDDTHGAIGIDEIDELFKNPKQNRDMLALIDSGHTKELKAYRMDMDAHPPKIVGYDPFGLKAFTRTSGIPHQLISRSITFKMVKNKGFKKINKNPKPSDFKEHRNQMYMYRLRHWKEVEKTYNELKEKGILEARQADLFLPLLTMAKLISEDLYDRILKYAQINEERRWESKEDERIVNLLEVLIENDFIGTVKGVDICRCLNVRLHDAGELASGKECHSRIVYGWLDGLGFEKSKIRTGNYTHFEISKELLIQQACIYLLSSVPERFPDTIDELKKLMEKEKGVQGEVTGKQKDTLARFFSTPSPSQNNLTSLTNLTPPHISKVNQVKKVNIIEEENERKNCIEKGEKND